MANSRYQQGAIKRFYENRGTMALQKLGEDATDLFLCDDPKKAAKLWDRVANSLKQTDAAPKTVERILVDRDIEALNQLVNQLTAPGRPAPAKSTQKPPTPPRPASPALGRTPTQDPPMDPTDKDVLKRALKAFRKRLKLTRLDEESNISGRSPLTGGKASSVVAITPPNQYPQAVWDELVKQGRLKPAGTGFYALVE